jgi:hypothetical protein
MRLPSLQLIRLCLTPTGSASNETISQWRVPRNFRMVVCARACELCICAAVLVEYINTITIYSAVIIILHP